MAPNKVEKADKASSTAFSKAKPKQSKSGDPKKAPQPKGNYSNAEFLLLWNVLQSSGGTPNVHGLADRIGIRNPAARMRWNRLRTKVAAWEGPEALITNEPRKGHGDNEGEDDDEHDEDEKAEEE